MKPTHADIVAAIPRALRFVEEQGGYADAELVDRELGPTGVAALMLASTMSERVEMMGAFLVKPKAAA